MTAKRDGEYRAAEGSFFVALLRWLAADKRMSTSSYFTSKTPGSGEWVDGWVGGLVGE